VQAAVPNPPARTGSPVLIELLDWGPVRVKSWPFAANWMIGT
jgi:hypothetical protein